MTMPVHSESNGQERVGGIRASYLTSFAREVFNQAMIGRLLQYVDRETLDDVLEKAQHDVEHSGFGAKISKADGSTIHSVIG